MYIIVVVIEFISIKWIDKASETALILKHEEKIMMWNVELVN